MEGRERVAQFYRYAVCLISVITVLLTGPVLIRSVFNYSDPLRVRIVRVRALLQGLALMGLIFTSSALGQTDEPPYTGAEPLVADQEFYRFQAVAGAKVAGVPAEAALATFASSSFTTSASVDTVLAHLALAAVETHRETVVDPDSLARSFLGSLDEDELSALALAVGNDLTGAAYREAFLAALDEGPPDGVQWGFVAHEGRDGSLTYYELQRPYFNVGSLRWVDATRIRVLRFPFGGG